MNEFRRRHYIDIYRSRYVAPSEKLWRESSVFSYPSAKPLSFKDELGYSATFFLESDGVYVGIKPPTRHSNRYRMERRLFTQAATPSYSIIKSCTPHDKPDGDVNTGVTLASVRTDGDDGTEKEMLEMKTEASSSVESTEQKSEAKSADNIKDKTNKRVKNEADEEYDEEAAEDEMGDLEPMDSEPVQTPVIDNEYVYDDIKHNNDIRNVNKSVWLNADGRLMDWEVPLCSMCYFFEDLSEENMRLLTIREMLMWGDVLSMADDARPRLIQEKEKAKAKDNSRFTLDIDVRSLLLFDHPMMSREEYLSVNLRKSYHLYSTRQPEQRIPFFREKVQALEKVHAKMKELETTNDASLEAVRNQIYNAKEMLYSEEDTTYQMVKYMVKMWADVKRERACQGYSSTRVVLKVSGNVLDRDIDEKRYKDRLRFELLKRKKQIANPEDWDDAAKEAVINELRSQLRQPGEPELIPTVFIEGTLANTPTADSEVPVWERERRRLLSSSIFSIKLFVGRTFISSIACAMVDRDMNVPVGTAMTLQLAGWPESIRLQFDHIIGDKKEYECSIGDIVLRVPGMEGDVMQSTDFESYEFNSAKGFLRHPLYEQKDNDVKYIDMSTTSFITGAAYAKVSWGADVNGMPLMPPGRPAFRPRRDAPWQAEALRTWLSGVVLDPNDPRNATMLPYLASMKAGVGLGDRAIMSADRFTLLDPDAVILRDENRKVSESRRTRLLLMRWLGQTAVSDQVPISDKYVTDDVLERLIGNVGDEVKAKRKDEEGFLERIRADTDALRGFGGVFNEGASNPFPSLDQALAKNIQRAAVKVPTSLDVGDVVIEKPLPTFSVAFKWFWSLVQKKRPLRPKRRVNKSKTAHAIQELDIVITVGRATRLPVRKSGGIINSFVEVKFRNVVVRTNCREGKAPVWNETVVIHLEEMKEILEALTKSAAGLSLLAGNIWQSVDVNVFDELVVDIERDDREEYSMHQRRECRWIGRFSVPFAVLLNEGTMEGDFPLYVPPVYLGYSKPLPSDSDKKHDDNPYISLYMTLEPSLPPPTPTVWTGGYTSVEGEKMVKYLRMWEQMMTTKAVGRPVIALVKTIDGGNALATRYIRPQAPPSGMIQKTPECLLRFVSMIPFVEDATVFGRRHDDYWSTTVQFLNVGAGDWEEHAILLCNYLLHNDMDAYIVIGEQQGYGKVAWVMTRGDDGHRLWNAGRGDVYSVDDPDVPLTKIGCLINSENVWVNVGPYATPLRMSFNLANKKNWQTLFNREYPYPSTPLPSLQADVPTYLPPNESMANDMEIAIEQGIIRALESARGRFVTKWNRNCSRALKKMLPKMERDRLGVEKLKPSEHDYELQDIFNAYQVQGHPINIKYTSMEKVISGVMDTKVHTLEDQSAEFGVGVYVYAYPCKVFSVWVYLCSLLSGKSRS